VAVMLSTVRLYLNSVTGPFPPAVEEPCSV